MNDKRKIKILHSPHRDDLAASPVGNIRVIDPKILDSDESVIEVDSVHTLVPEVIEPEAAIAP